MDINQLEVGIFKAMAHPIRLQLIKKLGENELCVCELNALETGTQSNVSQHLKVLKDASVVEQRRDGAKVYYRLKDTCILEMVALADQMIIKNIKAMETLLKG